MVGSSSRTGMGFLPLLTAEACVIVIALLPFPIMLTMSIYWWLKHPAQGPATLTCSAILTRSIGDRQGPSKGLWRDCEASSVACGESATSHIAGLSRCIYERTSSEDGGASRSRAQSSGGDQSPSMAKAARRSLCFRLRNNVRAALKSRAEPLSAAVQSATVVGWSTPQMKTMAFAKRPMASRSIVLSSIKDRSETPIATGETITPRLLAPSAL